MPLDLTEIVVAVLTIISGGALYGLLKIRNENRKLVAETEHTDANTAEVLVRGASSVVVLQREAMTDLRNQVQEQAQQIKALQAQSKEIDMLRNSVEKVHQELVVVTKERDRLARENVKLRHRVEQLEEKVEELSNGARP